MHTPKSLKDKKKLNRFFIYIKQKNSKICFNMYFSFNNKFIIAMRTRPIFQKNIFLYF